jgi:hypothetical protein
VRGFIQLLSLLGGSYILIKYFISNIKKKKKKNLIACRGLQATAEWSGRCWLRVHCRCAALLVLH